MSISSMFLALKVKAGANLARRLDMPKKNLPSTGIVRVGAFLMNHDRDAFGILPLVRIASIEFKKVS